MSRLSSLSSNPTLTNFAQGAAQSSIRPVAQFVAPSVDVPTLIGRFKKYTAKHRFKVPNTKRGLGGKAVRIGFDAGDGTYNCTANALDFPIDDLENLEDGQLLNMGKYGATLLADVAGLSHEVEVCETALNAAGAGTDINFSSADVDPVAIIDAQIKLVIMAAKNGAPVKIVIGASAWLAIKNNKNVIARFVANKKSDMAAVELDDFAALLFTHPKCMLSLMVKDTAAEGVDEQIEFILDTAVLIFASNDNPTTLDSSFMKTFRLMGQWMKPGSYRSEDDRGDVLKMDWSQDVEVTNAEAIKRLNHATA